ncbi:transposase [Streptomyces sp. S4.7]|uniref:transposase n=1 Tax=Streptomyces sp. S4.7 TaxID=2705439 RepID=UPI0013DAD701|nr:transposase [Streptomyces sp. S4.7]
MRADLSKRPAPDELWELVAPLLPSFAARPQGGGRAPRDERAVFTAVAHILTSGCAWRYLPEPFSVSPATAHRRFSVWTEAGLWRGPHRAVPDELGARGQLDWSSAIVDAASVREKKGGSPTGPNPADRGKKGSKLHALSEGQDLPPVVAVSGANRPSPGPLIDRRYDVNADMGPTAAAEQRAAAGRAPGRAGNLH